MTNWQCPVVRRSSFYFLRNPEQLSVYKTNIAFTYEYTHSKLICCLCFAKFAKTLEYIDILWKAHVYFRDSDYSLFKLPYHFPVRNIILRQIMK